MEDSLPTIGFSYFTSQKYQLNTRLREWLPAISDFGASSIIFHSDFVRAVPEDPFIIARDLGITPIVHFMSELPKAKDLNNAAVLIDTYLKRGVKTIILGDRPNTKNAWPSASWHDENLVEHFLDRFIPLANYAVQKSIKPVFPPLQPGGDFWDTSFMDLAISCLKNRKLDTILQNLVLTSYGYTFRKPLTWGMGGPERWTGSKPYQSQDGQEDQLGFRNFEWIQKIAERNLGYEVPIMVLNTGFHGPLTHEEDYEETLKSIKVILDSLNNEQKTNESFKTGIDWPDSVLGCYFSLEDIKELKRNHFQLTHFFEIFDKPKREKKVKEKIAKETKLISHYLLLPSHAGSVSDVVMNKVRPIIKRFKPTVGFSIIEASYAQKVSIFPDPFLFTEEKINQLRSSGCKVEILPESGIEIATKLQGI